MYFSKNIFRILSLTIILGISNANAGLFDSLLTNVMDQAAAPPAREGEQKAGLGDIVMGTLQQQQAQQSRGMAAQTGVVGAAFFNAGAKMQDRQARQSLQDKQIPVTQPTQNLQQNQASVKPCN